MVPTSSVEDSTGLKAYDLQRRQSVEVMKVRWVWKAGINLISFFGVPTAMRTV